MENKLEQIRIILERQNSLLIQNNIALKAILQFSEKELENKRMNNFEKIKQMSVDEMTEKISLSKDCSGITCNYCPINCYCTLPSNKNTIKSYLLQEVEE